LIAQAHAALGDILNVLPEPMFTVLRRWPNSLPLYAVGHLARIAELEKKVARLPHVRLIGNAYRGVGLPDLIRDGRNAAREMAATLVVANA
jgi:oxygen-dependent protoporphyrinogen oxidase